MFNQCHKLKTIKGIYNFNTTKVTNMSAMFQKCNELQYLDLSNFNTINLLSLTEDGVSIICISIFCCMIPFP